MKKVAFVVLFFLLNRSINAQSITSEFLIRTDGYYYSTTVLKTGDSLFHFTFFGSDGRVSDSAITGSFQHFNQPVSLSRLSYSYSSEGKRIVIKKDFLNKGIYDVTNCPCFERVKPEADGFILLEFKNKEHGWKKSHTKYTFVPFD